MLQCGAEWFFSKNVHNDLSVAYCKTLNQISNAAVAKCESIITFTVSAADSDLWWYNVLSRDDVWYGKKLLIFFREINFTKFSWNWFHEKTVFVTDFHMMNTIFFWYLIRLHIRDGKGNIDFYLTFHEKRWCMRVTLTFWHNNKALKIAKMQRSKA